jgi:hypothetical protein
MLTPVMRWMLPGAKNSAIGTVPAMTPMNRSVSSWLPCRAASSLWDSRTRSPVLTWDFYAARSYSLMRPPSTGLRLIRFQERSVAGLSGWGGRSWPLRWGRHPL